MAELSIGTQVKLRNGTSCKVKKELGRGGQGIVYLVDYNGKDYALKWYTITVSEAFCRNLEKNVKDGAPSSFFLWPEVVTEYQFGSCGYLMTACQTAGDACFSIANSARWVSLTQK